MASYNPSNNSSWANQAGQNRGFFSKALRDLSNWGMNYDDMVTKNKVTIGINEDPTQLAGGSEGMYDFFSQRAIASILSQKSIAYLDKAYSDKVRILREYSIKDEIRDFVTTIADETIVYDDDDKFCQPKKLDQKYPKEVRDRYYEIFEEIYNGFNFSAGNRAWDIFRRFLVDGFIAFEIVRDDKGQNIKGFEQIDPATVIPGYEPETGTHIWIQFPENPTLRRVILDSQMIYISYKTQNEYSETSYVESLIRPYNQLKIIEQTKIMFNIVNASIYQKFTIPVSDLSRQRAEESVGKMIANYSEEVEWDDTMGTIEINGSKHLPLNKQLWFPEGESGTPTFELVSPEGHNLNENDMLTWFFNALKRASKIPFSRFDKDNGGGNLYSDASEMTRDEIKFGNFIQRLRTTFREIMVKPIKLQLLMEFPEYIEDSKFINAIGVEFNSNDLFEEWKKLTNLNKRAEIVGNLSNAIEINEKPYLHPEFLIDEILKLTEEQKQKNESYWKKNPLKSAGGEGDGGFGDSGFGDSGFGNDFGGGSGEFGGEDFGNDFGGEDFGGGDTGGGDTGGGDTGGGDTGGGDDGDFEF